MIKKKTLHNDRKDKNRYSEMIWVHIILQYTNKAWKLKKKLKNFLKEEQKDEK